MLYIRWDGRDGSWRASQGARKIARPEIVPFFQTHPVIYYSGQACVDCIQVWMEMRRSVIAAAMCIGPLSTLIINRARRSQPNELQDRGVIEQVDAIVRHGDFAFCAAHKHDANRGKCVAKFFDRQIVERLTLPLAREGMEEDERFVFIEARDEVTSGERAPTGGGRARRRFQRAKGSARQRGRCDNDLPRYVDEKRRAPPARRSFRRTPADDSSCR